MNDEKDGLGNEKLIEMLIGTRQGKRQFGRPKHK
jgi:hypothetical protein